MDIEREKRKYCSRLVVAGKGAILFGLWSVIKYILYMTLTPEFIERTTGIDSRQVYIIAGVVLLLTSAIGCALRVYTGLCAISDGMGGKKRNSHLILAALFVILGAIEVVSPSAQISESLIDNVMNKAVTSACVCVYVEIILTTVRLRKLRRES